MLMFFDTETTGKWDFKQPVDSPLQPHICQLAALLTDLRGTEIAYFTCLVCPTKDYSFTIEPEAERVHGISLDQCKAAGVHINAAMLMFNQFIMNVKAAVAHNIDFDAKMVASTLRRIKKPNRLENIHNLCTMKIYTPIVQLPPKRRGTKYKWPTLTETYQHLYGEGFEGAHDALVDVRACKRVYFELPDAVRVNYEDGATIAEC